jgi:hypothetical protein
VDHVTLEGGEVVVDLDVPRKGAGDGYVIEVRVELGRVAKPTTHGVVMNSELARDGVAPHALLVQPVSLHHGLPVMARLGLSSLWHV